MAPAGKKDLKERMAEFRKITDDVINLRDILIKESPQYTLLSNVLDWIPILIYFKDLNNTLIKVNKHFCEISGMKKEEVENIPPELIPEQYKDLVMHYASNDVDVISTGIPKKGIIEKLFNSETLVRTDKFPVIVDGKTIGVLGISVEITN